MTFEVSGKVAIPLLSAVNMTYQAAFTAIPVFSKKSRTHSLSWRRSVKGDAVGVSVMRRTFATSHRYAQLPYNLRMLIGIVFSTTTGNTQIVAELIKKKLGDKAAAPVELTEITPDTLESFSAVLAGAPTWNTGADEQRSGTDWDDFLYGDLQNVKLKDTPVAIFGCGDSVGYEENFVDAMEEMHDKFKERGANMIGYVSTDGYEFGESKSVRDGKFLGLPIDEDNEGDLTEERVSGWCSQILQEIGL